MYDDTALRRLLIELAASHPEHAAVIRAFTPLALARGKLLDAYALSRKTKPLDGFPMFRFEELPVCSEKSGAIASAVLEAVAEGFPGAREQVEAVRGALKPGSVRRLCKASLAHEPEPLFAEKNSLSPDVLDMVIAQTVKILMARTAGSLPEAPFDPARKTCPYCGGKPELSIVHEKEGHRSLFCTDCGRHWRFQRTACPSCGCDKPDNLRLHFAENTPDERAVSCKNCSGYPQAGSGLGRSRHRVPRHGLSGRSHAGAGALTPWGICIAPKWLHRKRRLEAAFFVEWRTGISHRDKLP